MRKLKDGFATFLIWTAGGITGAILIWIVAYVVLNGISELNVAFLFGDGDQEGLVPMIISTVYIIGLALLLAAPLGILSAIYLVEYAKQGRLVRIIRFSIECLASIPSIIYGLFGLIFFVTINKMGFSLLSGALTVSIMILPTIIRTVEEALKTVPDSYREGSLGLGATKIRTIVKVVIPSSISGIVTSLILSVGRIIGETAAILLTAGMVARVPTSIMDSGRTLSVHLYYLAKEGISFEKAFATATVLLAVVLVLNLSTKAFARWVERRNGLY
ncbi:phosphate ABC transporter permease PstA [Acidaminobacter sp. JC074]|uniref:phosphate ABC transporter permease PstA n=1 Tax=Acidaminobacter sp. JC074 TaxID=2530199 RepID=UPI001F0D6DB0|nr:phosphate ABC transporter permease PstA [Acidaminobacter sp. JC074]MCH4891276.1 phosphate ABC transporter permease PstA [Acidaminobacter sp. JC074]